MPHPPGVAKPSTAAGAARWTPRHALLRAVQVVREEGPRSLLLKALGETVYRRLDLWERNLRAELSPSDDAGLAFDWLGHDRLDAYEALRPGHRARAAARLEAGHRCFATSLAGRLVAVRWLATGDPMVEYLGFRLPLAPGEVYHYDTYTDPALRRRGISAATQRRLFTVLRGEGYERAVRAVLPENTAAVRDAESAGFEAGGRMGFVQLGPWRREFVRRTPRAEAH